MRAFKLIIKIILILAIMGIVYSFFFSVYENIKINKMVSDFKNRAAETPTNETEITFQDYTYLRRYFEVPRETSYELADNKNVFYDPKKQNLGQTGDIFATLKSPFKNIPLIHQFVSFYYGGHAALVKYENNRPYFLEAVGFPDAGESIFDYIFNDGKPNSGLNSSVNKSSVNNWQKPSTAYEYHDIFYRDKYIGLRPVNPFDGENAKGLYDDYINQAVESAEQKHQDEAIYNFLFFLNMRNKYYCSDLVSRVYEEAYERVYNNNEEYKSKGYAKRMNDDRFITSVQDLILSKDTFITFYVEIKKEEINGQEVVVENIYYLEDVI